MGGWRDGGAKRCDGGNFKQAGHESCGYGTLYIYMCVCSG